MSVVRKSACRWFRNMKVHYLGGGKESIAIFYNPGRVCVEYETGDTPHPQIRRVIVYADGTGTVKLKIESVITEVPASMQTELFAIVAGNEANYGHYIASLLLPDGRTIHG